MEEREKKKYIYEKVMLCLYPHMDWIVKGARQSINNRALLSYKAYFAPEELMEKMIKEEQLASELEYAQAFIREILSGFDELEIALIECRCFKKGRRLATYLKEKRALTPKTLARYYRRTVRKFSEKMQMKGMDLDWFKRVILHYDWGRMIYQKACEKEQTEGACLSC